MNDFQPKPFGKYFLIEKLATGGMAEIYKAKNFGVDGFEKLLAIKRILPHCSSDKEFITMLIDEAKLSVVLSHTNIAQVYDLGKVGTDYFISMEFVDGINLRELINRAKETGANLPEDISVYIISEMCKGLDYAHAKKDSDGNPLNIVHRDISPQNILISYEGEVKIVDFGIAKAAMNMSHTMAGVLKGKITYMSPEQALGKPVDYKTDIFSAGLILHEMLTGQRFFSGETQFEVLKKIRTTRITEATFPESISPELKRILAKSLAYSSRDRFENAGDMQIELTKYLYSTYLDFSPRKLANLMKRLFAEEIQHKSTIRKDELSIDAQTRSILLESGAQQNLVHRDDHEKTLGRATQAHAPLEGHTAAVQVPAAHTQISEFEEGEEEEEDLGEAKTPIPLPTPAPSAVPSAPVTAAPKVRSKKSWIWAPVLLLLMALGAGGYVAYQHYHKPSPTQKIGIINIASNPPGAKIFLNDKDTNLVTPTSLQNIDLYFQQKISLKKEKFLDWTRLVTLVSPEALPIEAALEPLPTGTIEVNSQPPGAKVFLDGQDLGAVTPHKITQLDLNKTYTLKLEKEDHYPSEERVSVYSIEPIKYDKKLEPIKYGTIDVTTVPPGVKIFVNDQDTNLVTPNKVQKLEQGKTYTLRLSKDQYRDVVKTVEVANDKPILISEKLTSEEEIRKKEEEDKRKLLEKQKADEAKQKAEQERQAKLLEEQKKKEAALSPADKKKLEDQKKAEEAKKTTSPTSDEAKKKAEEEAKKAELAKKTTPPTTPTTPGGEFGSLRVTSDPPGAMVFIDGFSTGRVTPLTIRGVRRGKEHSVKLQLEGHKGWSSSVMMDADTKSLSATLQPK